jgi:hypothetical protein
MISTFSTSSYEWEPVWLQTKIPKKTTPYVPGAGILPGTRALRRSSVKRPAKAPVRQRLVHDSTTEKSTRHSTGSGTPVPSNSTSVRFRQKHAAPTLQRSASIRPKGISIEYADLMHFWWSFLFVGLLPAFAIPRLLQAVLVLILLLTHAPAG